MAKMAELRKMADELRAAHAAQAQAEKAVVEAHQRQSYWRAEIIKVLSPDEAGEFLDMLREQAGFLTADEMVFNYPENVRRFYRG